MCISGRKANNFALRAPRAKRPAHGKTMGDDGKAALQRGKVMRATRLRKDHAHEKCVAQSVVKLLRVQNVAAVLKQPGGNGGNNAGAVGAGEGEYEPVERHGICLGAREY